MLGIPTNLGLILPFFTFFSTCTTTFPPLFFVAIANARLSNVNASFSKEIFPSSSDKVPLKIAKSIFEGALK